MSEKFLEGEHDFLARVVDNLLEDTPKLVYADWLEEQCDDRCYFLRAFVAASRSMALHDFQQAKGFPEEWLELIGFRLLEALAETDRGELKERVLRLARPALRMKKDGRGMPKLPSELSKIGGLPDLPPGFNWPLGDECRAILQPRHCWGRSIGGVFGTSEFFRDCGHTGRSAVAS